MILVDMDREYTLNFSGNRPPTTKILAYIFPQTVAKSDDFRDRTKFAESVDEIESATKLDFFPGAEKVWKSKWQALEAKKEMTHWN